MVDVALRFETRKIEYLIYADYVNLLDENVNIMKWNVECLLDDSKEVGLEVNSEESMCRT